MTLTQLQEALSVKVGQRNLHPDDLVSGMDRITVWCENLVCVEETDNTVHFSHHSIREYLLQPGSGDLKDFHVDLGEFDHHAGEVCITYLHLENLKTALIESEKAECPPTVTVTMEGLSEQTVRTAVGGSMGARVGRWTSRVVKSTPRSTQPLTGDIAIHSTLGNIRRAPRALRGIRYVFLEYAEDNWFRHRTRLVHTSTGTDNSMWNLVLRLIMRPRERESLPWKDLIWRESVTRRDYRLLELRGSRGTFVPLGCFFMPPEREEYLHSRPTPDPMSDLTLIGCLPFLAVYAVQNNHESLACCAFLTFIQTRQDSPITKWLTLFLALEGQHTVCLNHCFARLQNYLSHSELVHTITLCFAAGVSHWPASASEKVIHHDQNRQCSAKRYLNFCQLIQTGYAAEDDSCIQDFASVALCAVTKADASRLPGLWIESSSLLTARTSNNMSIIDLAAEQGDEDGLRFLVSFFKPIARDHRVGIFEAARYRGEIEKLALGGLCTALRNGLSVNTKFLFNQCVDLFGPEQASQFGQLEIANLHLAMSQAAAFEWPFDTKEILSWFFEKHVVKRDMKAAMSHLIEESVKADNWKFASAVVDVVSDMEFERTECDDPFFKMILNSLSCRRCRGGQPNQRYELCSEHKRQALAALDAKLYP